MFILTDTFHFFLSLFLQLIIARKIIQKKRLKDAKINHKLDGFDYIYMRVTQYDEGWMKVRERGSLS